MHVLKTLFVIAMLAHAYVGMGQILCENESGKQIFITARNKIRVIYEVGNQEIVLKGRLTKIPGDSSLAMRVDGKICLIDIHTITSIEILGVKRYIKTALVGMALSALIVSFMPGNLDGASNGRNNTDASIFSIAAGTIFTTAYCTKKIFRPFDVSEGWHFSRK
jgi:hypothetical protein